MRIDCRMTAHWTPPVSSTIPAHVYEVRLRKDKRGTDLISGPPIRSVVVWRSECRREYNGIRTILQPLKRCGDRVYADAGNVIETLSTRASGSRFPSRLRA
jgi:hypothetical protein